MIGRVRHRPRPRRLLAAQRDGPGGAPDRAPTGVRRVSPDGLAVVDLAIRDARIAAVVGGRADSRDERRAPSTSGAAMVWPCLIDVHTHLDKGHTWERAPIPTARSPARSGPCRRTAPPTGRPTTCAGAWSSASPAAMPTARRRSARTWIPSRPQAAITWAVFEPSCARSGPGRIELQAVSLVASTIFGTARPGAGRSRRGGGRDPRRRRPTCRRTSTRCSTACSTWRPSAAWRSTSTATRAATSARAPWPHIARAVRRRRFAGRVVCGHCCSLAVQPPDVVAETLDLVAEAGIAVVSLPMCNLYLQDRVPGRTPRWRGVTLLHEIAARGIPVAVASDNCRDAFHGFGDHDMLEVFREATRIGHLDRPVRRLAARGDDDAGRPDGPRATPAASGRGSPPISCCSRAVTWSELLSRPAGEPGRAPERPADRAACPTIASWTTCSERTERAIAATVGRRIPRRRPDGKTRTARDGP